MDGITRLKGEITGLWRDGTLGWITGEDGKEYFFDRRKSYKNPTVRVGYLVEFEPCLQTEGEHAGKLEALNIVKVGHGKHHPLAKDIQQIGDFLTKNIPDDCEDKWYLLRNVATIYNYFCHIEDSQLYVDPRKQFRP